MVRVAGSKASLPERLMKRSAALLLLPKMPSPPEASSSTVLSLIVAGSISRSKVKLRICRTWLVPA